MANRGWIVCLVTALVACQQGADATETQSDQAQTSTRLAYNAIPLWPDGNLYYTFDKEVNKSTQNIFVEACETWTEVAEVHCVQRTSEANFVKVLIDDTSVAEGSSALGMQGGMQLLRLHSNASIATIVHELGHAFGRMHEHQRADRDKYVVVRPELFPKEAISEGLLWSLAAIPFYKPAHPYDYYSIMHYPWGTEASSPIQRIQPLTVAEQAGNLFWNGFLDYENWPSFVTSMWEGSLSGYDGAAMSELYGEPKS